MISRAGTLLRTKPAKAVDQAQKTKKMLCDRCGRDFAKLVERIADQRRFEDEQRAARAAEKAYDEGGAGGDSTAEAGNRKPKGLVWEVRGARCIKSAIASKARCIKGAMHKKGAMRQRADASKGPMCHMARCVKGAIR